MQDNQQLRQQDNGARQRKQPDEFKFRVGGRIRGVPLIVRFNYRVRQHEGDQAYKNHDLERFAGHDRVDRTTQPSRMQVAWLHAQGRRILTFSISVFTPIEFLRCGHPSAISTLAPGAKKPWFPHLSPGDHRGYLSAPFHAPGPQSIPLGQLQV